jgi:hypothetical protein
LHLLRCANYTKTPRKRSERRAWSNDLKPLDLQGFGRRCARQAGANACSQQSCRPRDAVSLTLLKQAARGSDNCRPYAPQGESRAGAARRQRTLDALGGAPTLAEGWRLSSGQPPSPSGGEDTFASP